MLLACISGTAKDPQHIKTAPSPSRLILLESALVRPRVLECYRGGRSGRRRGQAQAGLLRARGQRALALHPHQQNLVRHDHVAVGGRREEKEALDAKVSNNGRLDVSENEYITPSTPTQPLPSRSGFKRA